MTRNLARIALAVLTLSLGAVAQTGAAPATAGATKVGIVNIQLAVANSNEGKRDLDALDAKYGSRVKELQGLQSQVEDLTKQLNTQGDKLNAEARANLEKQISDKTKQFQRGREDYQNEVQGQEQEIFQRIAPKVMQTLDQYAKNNGYTLILDWGVLQNGVLWAGQTGVDITQPIIEGYNATSGVAAPVRPAGATGAAGGVGAGSPASRPAGGVTTPRPTARPAGTAPATPKK